MRAASLNLKTMETQQNLFSVLSHIQHVNVGLLRSQCTKCMFSHSMLLLEAVNSITSNLSTPPPHTSLSFRLTTFVLVFFLV